MSCWLDVFLAAKSAKSPFRWWFLMNFDCTMCKCVCVASSSHQGGLILYQILHTWWNCRILKPSLDLVRSRRKCAHLALQPKTTHVCFICDGDTIVIVLVCLFTITNPNVCTNVLPDDFWLIWSFHLYVGLELSPSSITTQFYVIMHPNVDIYGTLALIIAISLARNAYHVSELV